MSNYTHALFIDESGNGAKSLNLNHYWVTAGVAVGFNHKATLDNGVNQILQNHFRPSNKEIHACKMPRCLRRRSSIDAVAADVGALLDATDAKCWVAVTSYSSSYLPGLPPNAPAKAKARQLMYERVNLYLDGGNSGNGDHLIVWDISDHEELKDFSNSTALFTNPHNGNLINPKLAPAVLGGLSDDWSGLQIADIIAHFALHYCASLHLPGICNQEKAQAFGAHFWNRLHKNCPYGTITGYGWKTYL